MSPLDCDLVGGPHDHVARPAVPARSWWLWSSNTVYIPAATSAPTTPPASPATSTWRTPRCPTRFGRDRSRRRRRRRGAGIGGRRRREERRRTGGGATGTAGRLDAEAPLAARTRRFERWRAGREEGRRLRERLGLALVGRDRPGRGGSGVTLPRTRRADRANRTRESFRGPRGRSVVLLSPTSPPAEKVPEVVRPGRTVLAARTLSGYAVGTRTHSRGRLYGRLIHSSTGVQTDGRHDPSRPHRAGMDAAGAVPLFGARRSSFRPTVSGSTRRARSVTSAPVKPECLEYALTYRIDHGVWGGASERERRRILRRRRVDGRPVPALQPASVKVV